MMPPLELGSPSQKHWGCYGLQRLGKWIVGGVLGNTERGDTPRPGVEGEGRVGRGQPPSGRRVCPAGWGLGKGVGKVGAAR